MSELWDVYTIDRKVTGKTCFRGEQGNLSEDEFHLWVMVWIKNPETGKYLISQRVATSFDGRRHNWIRDSYYFETTKEPDLTKATTKEVEQTKWLSFTEIRKMYENGDVPSGVNIPSREEIYAQIAFQEQFYNGVLVGM